MHCRTLLHVRFRKRRLRAEKEKYHSPLLTLIMMQENRVVLAACRRRHRISCPAFHLTPVVPLPARGNARNNRSVAVSALLIVPPSQELPGSSTADQPAGVSTTPTSLIPKGTSGAAQRPSVHLSRDNYHFTSFHNKCQANRTESLYETPVRLNLFQTVRAIVWTLKRAQADVKEGMAVNFRRV